MDILPVLLASTDRSADIGRTAVVNSRQTESAAAAATPKNTQPPAYHGGVTAGAGSLAAAYKAIRAYEVQGVPVQAEKADADMDEDGRMRRPAQDAPILSSVGMNAAFAAYRDQG